MRGNIIFQRKIYQQMLDWKSSFVHNSALLIEGARRIGKSTIVEEFARNEFKDNYIMVDFRKESEDVKALFNNMKNLDTFFRLFFLSQNKVLNKDGLIIFDEVQFCPKAREAIKDLVNDGRYYYIETGSLISIKENVDSIMIPSEERRIEMYPMDFEEFLWAIEDNSSFDLFKEVITNQTKIPDSLHHEYLEKYRTYMVIGGMPKVLSIFLQTNSFKLANDEKLNIIKLYKDDLRKHDNKYGTICSTIFDSIPYQLAKENKRFLIKSTNKKRYEQIEKSLNDLCDFKIINKINGLSTLESPVALSVNKEQFKLYFCDTGLLMSMLINMSNEKMNTICFNFIKGKTIINLGSLFESVVVQQLTTLNYPLYFHKYSLMDKDNKKTKHYEIDLVLEKDFKVNAIEIKSSKNYTTSSLNNIKTKYPQLKVQKYILGVKNIKIESDKTTLPVYLTTFV